MNDFETNGQGEDSVDIFGTFEGSFKGAFKSCYSMVSFTRVI